MLSLFIGRGGSKLNELKMQAPSLWEEISCDKSEKVLCAFEGDRMMTAKVRLVSFSGDLNALRKEFRNRIASQGFIVNELFSNFKQGNTKWWCDSYTLKDTDPKYWDFYYTIQDNCYLVIEMFTNNKYSVLKFKDEIRKLINAVDYSAISLDNSIRIGEHRYIVKTPSLFRFSSASTDQQLLFLSENGYLLVNVPMKEDLTACVEKQIKSANLFIDSAIVELENFRTNNEFEEICYQIKNVETGQRIGVGIYFKQKLDDQRFVISFMFQRGKHAPSVETLLHFREDG